MVNSSTNKISFEKFSEKAKLKEARVRYPLPEELLRNCITDETEIPDLEPTILINGANFAVKGDLSMVSGVPKVGKTTICAFMIATALMKHIPEDFDSLGIRSIFCEGKDIVYVDTEQPRVYTNMLRKSILKLLGIDKMPSNLHIINLRNYKSKEKQDLVFKGMDYKPNAHLWIIDGVADLIQDPNNTDQSNTVMESFMQRAEKTTVVLHLHENPGGGKMRGNLGSEAERKCGGAISIKKKNGIHSIEPKVIRGSADFDPIYFRYSTIQKRMVSCDAEEVEAIRSKVDPEIIRKDLRSQLAQAITNNGEVSLKNLQAVQLIKHHSQNIEGKSIQDRAAQSRIKDMLSLGLLAKDDNGVYNLAS